MANDVQRFMIDQLKQKFRESGLSRHLVRRLLGTPAYRDQPIWDWPSAIAPLARIKVPSAVKTPVQPQAAGSANINLVFAQLQRTSAVAGNIAECGVFQGATITPMACWLRDTSSPKHIFGFDSFAGFDDSIAPDLELGGAHTEQRRVAGFNRTSLRYVSNKLTDFGVADKVTLVPGYFAETLHQQATQQFSFVHLDCDIYQSYLDCLEFFYPRLEPGGIILLDEYDDPSWPGCNKAVDEFLANRPEQLEKLSDNNFIKYCIVKC